MIPMNKTKLTIKRKERIRLQSLGEKPSSFYVVTASTKFGDSLFTKTFPSKIKAEKFVKATKERWKRMGVN